jgi:hypothetical protein
MAFLALVTGGCSRLQVRRGALLPPGLATTTTAARVVGTASSVRVQPSSDGGLSVADLPPGWATVDVSPPVDVASVVPGVAKCLGVKLADVAGRSLAGTVRVFRSSDSKEWVTASDGPGAVPPTTLPPSPDGALRLCMASAVAQNLAAFGFSSVSVRTVTVVGAVSSLTPRALDIRTTTDARVFGTRVATTVDVVWMTSRDRAAIVTIVDEALPGDLMSADVGLVAQATDAVARRLVPA